MIKIYQFINTNPVNTRFYSTPYYQRAYPTRHSNTNNYSIRVTGTGEVSVKPNQAVVLLGIVTEDMKVQNAQQQNANISNQVIDALKNIGINQEEIETSSFTIDRIVEYHDSQQIFKGYRVSHFLKVIVKDLASVGKVIDVATENGANEVRNITFEVSDTKPYYAEALQKATLNAKFNAENIAKAMGVTISSIPNWIAEEGTRLVKPQHAGPMVAAAFSGQTTPIQEGQVKITASVQAMFNYVSF